MPGHVSGENHASKRYMLSSVHNSTIYNSQDTEATQMSINRGMDKDVEHRHNGLSLSHKKEKEIMPLAGTWVDPETVELNEASQTEKDKYHMTDVIYMWNLKKRVQLYK